MNESTPHPPAGNLPSDPMIAANQQPDAAATSTVFDCTDGVRIG